MKSSLPIARLLFLFAWLITALPSIAQNPSFSCYITNETRVSNTIYQFDLYLLSTGSNAFLYAGGQWGITVNSAVANGGTLTASIVAGSSTLSNSNQVPISVSLPSSTYVFNISGRAPPGVANASTISSVNNGCSSPGTRIATFQITNSVPFATNSHMNHTFNFVAAAGATQTTINAYVGALNTDVTANGTFYDYLASGSCLQNISLGCDLTASASSTSVNCFGGSNGTATVSQTGGTSPFSYLWNNGQTSQTATGLIAGNYTVTVTDAGGCSATASTTVSQPTALLASSSVISNVSCNNSGSVSVAASGGTSPYNGTGTFNGLTAGTYTYIVTDAHGCTASTAATITQQSNSLIATCSGTNVSCSNGSDGSVSVSVSGGTPSYSYLWSNGATTSSVSNIGAGTYSVVVTDNNGCTASCSHTVNPCNHLTMSLQNCSQPDCNTIQFDLYVESDGSPTSDLRASAFQYGINFNTGILQSGASITPSYVSGSSDFIPPLQAFSFASSSYPDHIRIVESPLTTNTGNTMTVGQQYKVGTFILTSSAKWVANSNPSFALQATVVGGKTVCASVVWVGNAANPITISATGTGNNQRSVVVSCSLTLNPCNLSVSASSTNVSCFNGSNGTATVSTSGGCNPSLSYLWSNGQTDQTATDLVAGSYSVTVSDDLGCTATSSVTITQPTQLTAVSSIISNVSCNGGANGSVAVGVSGGTAPYSGTGTFSGLAAGNYTYIVTDANGCTAATTATITQPSALTANASVVSNVSCHGGVNGSVAVGATGGTAPYSGTGTFSGLAAGNYNYIVTDANGCTANTTVTITQPSTLTASISASSNLSCRNVHNGSVTVSAGGGTAPYSGTGTFSGLAAGSHSFTVTDANGCTATTSIALTQPLAVLTSSCSSTDVSCSNGFDGSVSVTASGGTPSYSYLWSNGATTASVSNVGGGSYTVTVTDSHGCTSTCTTFVNACDHLTMSLQNCSQPTCNTIQFDLYVVSDGSPTSDLRANAFQYGVNFNTAILQSGASITPSYVAGSSDFIPPLSGFNFPAAGSSDHIRIVESPYSGSNTGSTMTVGQQYKVGTFILTSSSKWVANSDPSFSLQSVAVAGKTTTATVVWVGNSSSTIIISDTGTGADQRLVAVSCSLNLNPCSLSASASSTPASCGGNNGTATVSTSGGCNPTFTYLWSNGQTTQTATGLVTGNYSVTVTDDVNCTASTSVAVGQISQLIVSQTHTDVSCNGGSNGTATISASNGSAPYSGTGTFTGLTAGTYSYTVTDASGCTATTTVTISQPPALSASVIQNAPILCHGGSTTVTVSASGGTSPYSGTGTVSVSAGERNYTVTDAHGCTSTISIPVTEPSALSASSSVVSNISCNGGSNGSASVAASGGTGPYSGTGTFSGLAPGNHTFTVTDANGCTVSTSVTISQPSALSASVSQNTPILCHGGSTTVTISASGGTSPYNGTGTVTANAGTYNYTVTDANGCTAIATITITQPSSIAISLGSNTPVCAGGSINLTSSASGGTGSLSYSWTGPNGFSSTDANPTINSSTPANGGTYTLTVTDGNSCSTTVTTAVIVQDCNTILNLKAFLEGFYRGGSTMIANLYNLGYNGDSTVSDSIQIDLWAPTHLGNLAPDYSMKTLLHVNGTASATLSASVIGNSYFIAVRHRNHMQTWSHNTVTFATVTNYDFSTAESKAYDDGINQPMKNMGGSVFAFYGGDENQDGNIDIADMGDIDNATQSFAFGYNPTDINGDGSTDISDMAIVDNNSQLFLYFARPY